MIHGPYREAPDIKPEPEFPKLIVTDAFDDLTKTAYRLVQRSETLFMVERKDVLEDGMGRTSHVWRSVMSIEDPEEEAARRRHKQSYGYYNPYEDFKQPTVPPSLLWWFVTTITKALK